MNKKGEFSDSIPLFGGIFVVVFMLCVIGAFMGFDQVDANHRGVMVKFGQIQGVMEAGIQWTGIFTSTYEYDLRIRQVKVDMLGEQSAVDNTGQAIFGQVSVNYRLKSEPSVVSELYRNVGFDDVIAQRLNIEPIIKEGFKQATVQYEAQEILQNRQAVKELAKENIKKNFPSEYFEIVDIVVENIDFSADYKLAIEQKKIATQNKLREQEQVEVVKFQQEQKIVEYQAEAERLRLQKAEISPLLIHQQWIAKWDGQLPIYMITPEGNADMMLMLPEVTE